jgi:hypothetical protein
LGFSAVLMIDSDASGERWRFPLGSSTELQTRMQPFSWLLS